MMSIIHNLGFAIQGATKNGVYKTIFPPLISRTLSLKIDIYLFDLPSFIHLLVVLFVVAGGDVVHPFLVF